MAKLTSGQRGKLPASDFVLQKQRKYPIEDRSHAANAKSRAAQSGNPSLKARVYAAVARKYPGMGK